MNRVYAKKQSCYLSDIATISVGYPFRGSMSEVEGTGVIAIQLKDASATEGVNWKQCLETELTGKRKPDWIGKGDILFSTRGQNNHAVLIDGIPLNKKVVASPHFFVIRCKQDNVVPEYLAWLLNQSPCQRHFKREAEGTLVKSIRRKVLENTPITIASLQTQKSIINLANTLKQEQHILKQLIHNGEITMNAIANDLFASDTVKEKI